VSEEAAGPIAASPCSACRGSGIVISNLGGEPHEQQCPWCDGGGVILRDHDAQARWREDRGLQEPPASSN
jgi:DnaJ-class molecular chaperone